MSAFQLGHLGACELVKILRSTFHIVAALRLLILMFLFGHRQAAACCYAGQSLSLSQAMPVLYVKRHQGASVLSEVSSYASKVLEYFSWLGVLIFRHFVGIC